MIEELRRVMAAMNEFVAGFARAMEQLAERIRTAPWADLARLLAYRTQAQLADAAEREHEEVRAQIIGAPQALIDQCSLAQLRHVVELACRGVDVSNLRVDEHGALRGWVPERADAIRRLAYGLDIPIELADDMLVCASTVVSVDPPREHRSRLATYWAARSDEPPNAHDDPEAWAAQPIVDPPSGRERLDEWLERSNEVLNEYGCVTVQQSNFVDVDDARLDEYEAKSADELRRRFERGTPWDF